MSDKTHYRRVFKSDHLGIADLEDYQEAGSNLQFEISHVKQEIGVSVAGRKGNHNIAYFKEQIKPLVLNATNAKTIKSFCNNSPFVEDWNNIRVQLYIDPHVKMKGEIVGGVRIHPNQPQSKATLQIDTPAFDRAVAAFIRDKNIHKVTEYMIVTDDVFNAIKTKAAESNTGAN